MLELILNWILQNVAVIIVMAFVLIVLHKTGTLEPILDFIGSPFRALLA